MDDFFCDGGFISVDIINSYLILRNQGQFDCIHAVVRRLPRDLHPG
jgi:hypothetical protein